MDAQREVLSLLSQEFAKARLKNPSFSQRAYARKLGIHPSAISGLMAGKLRVTRKSARKIFITLGVDPVFSKKVLGNLKDRTDKPKDLDPKALLKITPDTYTQLDLEQYHILTHWVYSAILLLSETVDFSDDPKWIATRLGAPINDVKNALKRLLKLGMLAENAEGKLISTGKKFKTTTDIPNLYIRAHHIEGLELARNKLEGEFSNLNDFSGTTMAIDPEKIAEAKVMISEFRKRLAAHLGTSNKKEVYRLAIQFFSITQSS